MSSILSKTIKISVTNGDAFSETRLKGRSNTGTYFLCSNKDFSKFNELISSCKHFYLDYKGIEKYSILFKNKYFQFRNLYIDKMSNFDNLVNKLSSINEYYEVELDVRKNDSRNFLRFVDNDDEFVYCFRHLLYAKLSLIVLEFVHDKCFIYADITNVIPQLENEVIVEDTFIDEED